MGTTRRARCPAVLLAAPIISNPGSKFRLPQDPYTSQIGFRHRGICRGRKCIPPCTLCNSIHAAETAGECGGQCIGISIPKFEMRQSCPKPNPLAPGRLNHHHPPPPDSLSRNRYRFTIPRLGSLISIVNVFDARLDN